MIWRTGGQPRKTKNGPGPAHLLSKAWVVKLGMPPPTLRGGGLFAGNGLRTSRGRGLKQPGLANCDSPGEVPPERNLNDCVGPLG